MDQEVERRIRDRAYAIWKEEGCPEGRDAEHWMKACEEVAAEDGKDVRVQSASGAQGADARGSGDGSDAQGSDAQSEKPKRGRTARAAGKDADAKENDRPATKGRKSAKSG